MVKGGIKAYVSTEMRLPSGLGVLRAPGTLYDGLFKLLCIYTLIIPNEWARMQALLEFVVVPGH